MRRMAVIGVVSAAFIVSASGSIGTGARAVAQEQGGFHCSAATIRGTYGIQMQGTNPVPPPLGGGIQTVIGVVVRTYDGAGTFHQVDNIKGSVTGIVPMTAPATEPIRSTTIAAVSRYSSQALASRSKSEW